MDQLVEDINRVIGTINNFVNRTDEEIELVNALMKYLNTIGR